MQSLSDIMNDDSDESSSDEIKEMTTSKLLTTRVRSEWFNGPIDFDTIEDSEHSSDEDELPKTEIFTGGYSIGKENEE